MTHSETIANLFFSSVPGLVIKTTLVLLVGWIVSRLLIRRTASLRHLVWTATLIAVLVLPLATRLIPVVELPWLPSHPTHHVGFEPPPDEDPPVDARLTAEVPSPPVVVTRAPTQTTRLSWFGVTILIYSLGVVFVLAAPLVGILRLASMRDRVQPLSDAVEWRPLLDELDRARSIPRRVTLATAPDLTAPMTWGMVRPVVLLPREAATWSVSERRHALLHELAHVERFDWCVQMLTRLVCALYWFHPLVWLASRRLSLEAERAADDRVLLAGARSGDYADQLLRLARRFKTPRLPDFGAVTMARRHQMWIRIDSILDPTLRRSSMTRPRPFVIVLLSLVCLAFVAPLSLVPAGQTTEDRASLSPTSLIGAAARGDVATARSLLEAGADPDLGRSGRGTPLIQASGAGNLDMVELLLAHGADPNLAVEDDLWTTGLLRTPLATAARAGHVSIVRRLLEAGAEVDTAPPGDPTPLMAAAEFGHGETVEVLIEHGSDVGRIVNGDGTPLIAAARGGNDELVELLLDHGAEPDQWVPGDENALFHAIQAGDLDAVETLIDAGVDVDATWGGDGTPLLVAARRGEDEIAERLLAEGARADKGVHGDGNAMIVAAAHGNEELLRLFIRSGADVNASVRGDGSPLISAARSGHLDVVRLLVENGAEVDMVVRGDENALIQAAEQGHLDVASYLLDRGADPNARVRSGLEIRTPLRRARLRRHEAMVDLLRSHGAEE